MGRRTRLAASRSAPFPRVPRVATCSYIIPARLRPSTEPYRSRPGRRRLPLSCRPGAAGGTSDPREPIAAGVPADRGPARCRVAGGAQIVAADLGGGRSLRSLRMQRGPGSGTARLHRPSAGTWLAWGEVRAGEAGINERSPQLLPAARRSQRASGARGSGSSNRPLTTAARFRGNRPGAGAPGSGQRQSRPWSMFMALRTCTRVAMASSRARSTPWRSTSRTWPGSSA